MTQFIEKIITTLSGLPGAPDVNEALLNAAFVFEKSRGISPCGWPDDVVAASVSSHDVARLRDAVAVYVEREGIGSWTLGKCCDPVVKPILVAVLRRQLDGDSKELFNAMMALEDLGEPVFGEARFKAFTDESRNRELARKYLSRLADAAGVALSTIVRE